jgi:hypothetical protein
MVDGRSPLGLGMLGLEACIFCNRNHPVIHASQPFLFYQNFAGIILMIASTIIPLSLDLACPFPGSITFLFFIRLFQDFARFL